MEREYSEKTAEEIDAEVKHIMDEAYQMAKQVLGQNREKVEHIAQALLKYETLDAEEVKLIIEGGRLDKPTVGDLLAAEQAKAGPEAQKQNQEKDRPQERPLGGLPYPTPG
jgi:cell division protease FtsH